MDNNIKISSNRSFGIIFFFVFCLIAFYPLLKDGEIRIWSISVALLFLILGLINSRLLTPLNRLWFKFGIFLAKFVSPIVMAFVFFGVVTPTGLLMKFFKKDILKLKKNSSKTYWIKKTEEKSSMKNQF
tara:strand:- start:639 stop:1025 length:387 start_codon:yes stop_codon:yes gene_type:complete